MVKFQKYSYEISQQYQWIFCSRLNYFRKMWYIDKPHFHNSSPPLEITWFARPWHGLQSHFEFGNRVHKVFRDIIMKTLKEWHVEKLWNNLSCSAGMYESWMYKMDWSKRTIITQKGYLKMTGGNYLKISLEQSLIADVVDTALTSLSMQ